MCFIAHSKGRSLTDIHSVAFMEVTKGECQRERRSRWRKEARKQEFGRLEFCNFFHFFTKINLASFLNLMTGFILLSFLKAR